MNRCTRRRFLQRRRGRPGLRVRAHAAGRAAATFSGSARSPTTRRSSACSCSAATTPSTWSCRAAPPSTPSMRPRARISRSRKRACCRSIRSCPTEWRAVRPASLDAGVATCSSGPGGGRRERRAAASSRRPKAQYQAKAVRLPPQLFSHNDQQDQWHSLKGEATLKSGWAGRIADALHSPGAATPLTSARAQRLACRDRRCFRPAPTRCRTRWARRTAAVLRARWDRRLHARAARGVREHPARQSRDGVRARLFRRTAARTAGRGTINAALATVRAPKLRRSPTAFPATPLGQQLKTVAKLIAVRDQLEMSRQIFFVATGGFDTHDDQVARPAAAARQPEQLPRRVLPRDGRARRRAERHDVHAVGFRPHAHVERRRHRSRVGRHAARHRRRGRRPHVYGRYPLLQIDGPDDVGGGRMIPGLSSDQYAATLAQWFGVPASRPAEHRAPHRQLRAGGSRPSSDSLGDLNQAARGRILRQ